MFPAQPEAGAGVGGKHHAGVLTLAFAARRPLRLVAGRSRPGPPPQRQAAPAPDSTRHHINVPYSLSPNVSERWRSACVYLFRRALWWNLPPSPYCSTRTYLSVLTPAKVRARFVVFILHLYIQMWLMKLCVERQKCTVLSLFQ